MVKVVKNLILMVFLQMQMIMFLKNKEQDLLRGISNLMTPMVLMQKFLTFKKANTSPNYDSAYCKFLTDARKKDQKDKDLKNI